MDRSLVVPILRSGEHDYLEIVTDEDFAALFDENTGEDEIDVSSLGIYLLGMNGLKLLEKITRKTVDQLVMVEMDNGKRLELMADQGVFIFNHEYNGDAAPYDIIRADELQEGDQLIPFSGHFNDVFDNQEYIDLISEFAKLSVNEKLGKISVIGIREYMKAVSGGKTRLDRMDLGSFASLVKENGVYDEELNFLKLTSERLTVPVSSKLYLTDDLFRFLGYFWNYGQFVDDCPVLLLPDYDTARNAASVAKKAMNAGVTILPDIEGMFRISLHSPIFSSILEDIFGLQGIPRHSALPTKIFNVDDESIRAFLSVIISEKTITSKNYHVIQQILLLCSTLNLSPTLFMDKTCTIVFSDVDMKILEEEEIELKPQIERISHVGIIELDTPETHYYLSSGISYFAGYGILLSGRDLVD